MTTFERDARRLGMRSGMFGRSDLSLEPADVDYKREALVSGKRPLPTAIANGTWQSLMKATGLEAVDSPATRFIGVEVIADALGISSKTLNEHKNKPGFPRHALRGVGWLTVADIDGIAAIEAWLRKRRVGPAKNHIKRRAIDGRARRRGG